MIFTSYFGNFKNIKNPVSICGKAPDFYKGPQYKKLAPKYSFFRDYKDGKIGEQEYTELYREQVLNHLNANDVVKDIESFYPNDDVTLICYEKPGDFCHRHIVAEWLIENGFQSEELKKELKK